MTETPPWDALKRPTPEWFRKAPFGIFFHWGPYSVPAWAELSGELGAVDEQQWWTHNAYAEWYYNTIRIEGSPAQQHHQKTYGGVDYDHFLDEWKAENFDAEDWMDLAVAAGADYVVPTTKHHDGIPLWDAPETGTRNTVHRGPKQDLIRAITEAARARGLRLGLYYSGGLDWHVRHLPAHTSHESVSDTARPKDAEFARYVYTHFRDLIDRFEPDIIWNDINWPDEGKHFGDHGLGELFQYFYQRHPDGLVNDRWGRETHFDYSTSEYQMTDESALKGPWEYCRGIGLSFGYNQLEGEDEYLDGPAISRLISDVVSRGGRVLLNIGPKADGTIPEAQRQALLQTGRWMERAKRWLTDTEETNLELTTTDGGWVRALEARDGDGRVSTVLFIDRPDGSAGNVQVTGLEQLQDVSTETPEWCTIHETGGGHITVELSEGRPGPAVVRI